MDRNRKKIKELILEELREITYHGFPLSPRKNVSNNAKVHGFTLGHVWAWNPICKRKIYVSKYNKQYPKLYALLKGLMALYDPKFNYSTIQVNYNLCCKRHYDKNNVGNSYTMSFGDYTKGGELHVENKHGTVHSYNTKNRMVRFDGRLDHWVSPFQGERYSVVFFKHSFM
tara:strand:- start:18 stop:530 length:513 start_codon:yes stop_codon:yes gene_type:complete